MKWKREINSVKQKTKKKKLINFVKNCKKIDGRKLKKSKSFEYTKSKIDSKCASVCVCVADMIIEFEIAPTFAGEWWVKEWLKSIEKKKLFI